MRLISWGGSYYPIREGESFPESQLAEFIEQNFEPTELEVDTIVEIPDRESIAIPAGFKVYMADDILIREDMRNLDFLELNHPLVESVENELPMLLGGPPIDQLIDKLKKLQLTKPSDEVVFLQARNGDYFGILKPDLNVLPYGFDSGADVYYAEEDCFYYTNLNSEDVLRKQTAAYPLYLTQRGRRIHSTTDLDINNKGVIWVSGIIPMDSYDTVQKAKDVLKPYISYNIPHPDVSSRYPGDVDIEY